MSADELAIQFLANVLNEADAKRAGYAAAARWGVLDPDVKADLLNRARAAVTAWAVDEDEAAEAREVGNRRMMARLVSQ